MRAWLVCCIVLKLDTKYGRALLFGHFLFAFRAAFADVYGV